MKANYSVAAEVDLIDWEQVDLLVGDKDVLPDEMREIYNDFTLDAASRINEFRESLPLMDQEIIGKQAHYLKGAARSLGFVDLANRLGHIEHLRHIPKENEWDRLTRQLDRSLHASLEKLAERFPTLGKQDE